MSEKRQVSYFYDPEVGNYHYGNSHPMKPHRIQITNSLVLNYNLDKKMAIYKPRASTEFELMRYHSREYINFLQKIKPGNKEYFQKEMREFNVGEDSPVFAGMYDFVASYTGASVAAAQHLNTGLADIAVNWERFIINNYVYMCKFLYKYYRISLSGPVAFITLKNQKLPVSVTSTT